MNPVEMELLETIIQGNSPGAVKYRKAICSHVELLRSRGVPEKEIAEELEKILDTGGHHGK